MASVFDEQRRQITGSRLNVGLDRVRAQGKKPERPKESAKTENASEGWDGVWNLAFRSMVR